MEDDDMRFFAAAILLVLVQGSAGALDVGVARCDITPDVAAYRVPMAGYGSRMGRPSTGVHDPLLAKVLYFRDGDTRMVLVTADLRSSTPEFKAQIVEKAGEGFTKDNVFVCASHTHAGPSMYAERFWQFQFGKYDPAIVDIMSTRVAEAIHEAVKNAAPARVGFGETPLDGFTRNRRWDDGQAAREAAGESPALCPRLWAMRVDGLDGACRAVLVNFATHPTILDADNMLLTAEWPGVLQRKLEEALPGTVALFCNGAEGDQSPEGVEGEDGFARIESFGGRLAEQAAALAKGIETKPDLSIGYVRVTPDLPEMVFSEGAKKGPFAGLAESAREALPRQAELQLFRIGDTALAGLPGEPLCEVGRAVESSVRAAGLDNVITVGLANDYIGYLVNEKEYAHGGYEVDQRSYYGPGLGAFLAEESENAARQLGAK
jgi:hypothetical protein